MRPLCALAPAAWVVWLACGPVLGQTTSGSLTGTVRTEEGTPVGDAVIQAASTRDGALRSAVSDGAGHYRLDQLEPGEWRVVARLTDGEASESRTIVLHLQQTIQLDFTVAGLVERVTVRAETPLVDRRETARGLRLTGEQADTLPLAGRQFSDLALLDSAARQAAPGNFYGERDAVFVVNGQSGRSNSFLVDGLDNNDQVSGTTLNSTFSQQVIDEFVLLTHQFAPEFGRATGGVLNIVTKQGTNEPSFGFFAQGTDERWNQTGSFVAGLPEGDVGRDAVGRYQGGFNLGGPLRRDRAFYFAAYERQRA